MSGVVEAAGAVKNPSKYAGLGMGARQFTGLVTQRSPYRDGAVPYLVGKFYGGSRFDTIIDGLNREISQRLTDVRRPGFSPLDTFDFAVDDEALAESYFSWKYIQDRKEVITVLEDFTGGAGGDGGPVVFLKSTGNDVRVNPLLTKPAGAGPARFLGVNTELFITDGVQPKKFIGTGKTWQPNTKYNAGDLITDSNGNLQRATAVSLIQNIESVQYFTLTGAGGATHHYVILAFDETMQFALGSYFTVSLSGLTTATWLNGATLTKVAPYGSSGQALIAETSVVHADYGPAPDTGTADGSRVFDDDVTGFLGTSGATEPTWMTGQQEQTADGSIDWQCYGSPLKDWGLPTPVNKLLVEAADETELYWQPNTNYPAYSAIYDANRQLQLSFGVTSSYLQPTWNTAVGGFTADGGFAGAWQNGGQQGAWLGNTPFTAGTVILDSNGNLQLAQFSETTGMTAPTWSTTPGGVTVDNGFSLWVCYGPGAILRSGTITYSYSWHSIDGSVSNAAPLNATVVNGVIGKATPLGYAFQLTGTNPFDEMPVDQSSQIDQVWIWRTVQAGVALILLAQLPVDDQSSTEWSFLDTLSDLVLGETAEITGPIAEEADPPPTDLTAPVYYLGRVWGITGNKVVYSGGPDTVTGNGNTTFPPLNFIPFLAQPVRLVPVTVQGGALLVFTTDGAYIVLGSGIGSDPFFTTPYYASVSLAGYNALDVYNNSVLLMESNGKVSQLAVEYPFNPQTGYTEIGFPIGDQFLSLNTGGHFNEPAFDPATVYVSWHNAGTSEAAMFVCNGSVDGPQLWFRLSLINPPESGMLWSPLGQLQQSAQGGLTSGGGAMQSVETSPGIYQLLAAVIDFDGNHSTLYRDPSVFADWDSFDGEYVAYPAWDAKGVTLLCGTGEWADVAHISTKSKAVGVRPKIGVLFNEIAPKQPSTPGDTSASYAILKLDEKTQNPSRGRRSVTVFSDRYDLEQNGVETEGDCLLTLFDYGTQNVPDELYDFGIYASVHDEREAQEARS